MGKAEKITGKKILEVKTKKQTNDLVEQALIYTAELEELSRRSKKIKALLEPIEAHFDSVIEAGEQIITPAGTVIKNVANSYSVKPEKYGELKMIFKRKIGDFVVEKTTYGCQPALRNLLADAEYEHGDTLRDAVIIKQSTTIKFKEAKDE